MPVWCREDVVAAVPGCSTVVAAMPVEPRNGGGLAGGRLPMTSASKCRPAIGGISESELTHSQHVLHSFRPVASRRVLPMGRA